jgi:hypothetical protein
MSHEADDELAEDIDLVIGLSVILVARAHVEAECLADHVVERNCQEKAA